ncbi:MAG: aminopeptidase P family protein [Actinomycetota bacterium]|nr:aminopeptidase P family protein [Actinomycetota bacterium]MDA8208730.1 aminopeptidase P family protein [Actinomycetota bacterium]
MKDPLPSIDLLADADEVVARIRELSERDFREARAARLEGVQRVLEETGTDALVLSLGADLPWLTGYEAMPLERLTALVVARGATPVLLVPELEAPRVRPDDDLFSLRPWAEGSDPYELVAQLLGKAGSVAVSDRMWATALLEIQRRSPGAAFSAASSLLARLRGQKDAVELLLLARAAHITDIVAEEILSGALRLAGREEREVSADISARLVAHGLQRVNFAIVGSGPNSASPHHEPGARVISSGDPVVLDFGGVYGLGEEPGYCSDTTRTVVVEEIPDGFIELYHALHVAQAAARREASSTISGAALDAVARDAIEAAGFGQYFIHRTGHGIGLEEHEEPYVASGNKVALGPYAAFSIEPGIYIPGRFGARIEDICIAGEHHAVSINRSSRDMVIV